MGSRCSGISNCGISAASGTTLLRKAHQSLTIGLPGPCRNFSNLGRLGYSTNSSEKRVDILKSLQAALKDKTSTLVFRKAHWMFPRYFPGGARSDLRIATRFSELFVEYPNRTKFEIFLHGRAKPIVTLWWAFLSKVVPLAAKMPKLLIPEHRLPTGFESAGVIDDFFDLLNAGRITAKRTSIAKFTETGVELVSGERLDADLVVFATGWRRDLSFLEESLKNQIIRSDKLPIPSNSGSIAKSRI